MRRSALRPIILLGVSLLLLPTITLAGRVIVVDASIQAAVDMAEPGDIIVVPPGIYHESVEVTRDNLTIVGSAAAVIDATGFPNGIRVGKPGGFPFPVVDGVPVCPQTADPSRVVHHFVLAGLTIKHAAFSGVLLLGVHGFHLTAGTYLNNAEYGPFPVCSRQGRIDFNVAAGHNDAAIYVGDAEHVVVRQNVVTRSTIGIEIENSRRVVVEENWLSGNTTGILVVVLPGLPMPFTRAVQIKNNVVLQNNRPNPIPVESDDPVGQLPTGTGILNIGGDKVVIRQNVVLGNNSVGVAIIENPFAVFDPRIERSPDNNAVRDNVILRNGTAPDPDRPTTPGADIVYDGSGVKNCFAGNRFRTQVPAGITADFPCP